MLPIGLFYGSTTCYTEMVAEKIQSAIGNDVVSLHNIKDQSLNKISNYDILILGISTWDYGELQEDWESNWDDILDLDLSGKVVALYGMGDQVGYPDWYQDALGMLFEQLQPTGAHIIGFWPNEGYEFNTSKALTDDKTQFVGLAIDDENQYQLTDERISLWTKQILKELNTLLES